MIKKSETSIASQGARLHFEISIVLISIIPVLTLAYILFSSGQTLKSISWLHSALIAMLLPIIILGYIMLSYYPKAVVKLREYVTQVAKGEFPDQVDLSDVSDDLIAIEKYFNMVLVDMKARITLVEKQSVQLIAAERERVMLESVGAACHHIGQPATVLMTSLDALKTGEDDPDRMILIESSIEAINELGEVLKKLQSVAMYKTETYIKASDVNTPKQSDENILKI